MARSSSPSRGARWRSSGRCPDRSELLPRCALTVDSFGRARAARRRVRPRLRHQPLRLRLLHGHDADRPQPRQPLHGRRLGDVARCRAARSSSSTSTTLGRRPTTTAARSTSAPTASSTSPSARTPTAPNAQSLATLQGKILRINPDGSHPRRQPVLQHGHGQVPRDLGARPAQPVHLRVPARHRADVHQRRGPGHLRGDQRGPRRRQLRLARSPKGRPPTRASSAAVLRLRPQQGQAIAGGAFYNPPVNRVPGRLRGRLLLRRFRRRHDPPHRPLDEGRVRLRHPRVLAVDLRVGSDGALYYLSRGLGQVLRVDATATPPRTAPLISLQTDPPGLPLGLDGQAVASPITFVSPAQKPHAIEAAEVRLVGARDLSIRGWSDGGAASHTFATPSASTTLVATYRLIAARVNFQPGDGPRPPATRPTPARLRPAGRRADLRLVRTERDIGPPHESLARCPLCDLPPPPSPGGDVGDRRPGRDLRGARRRRGRLARAAESGSTPRASR